MKDYDYKNIDAIFHSPIRLAAASMLYHDGKADFNTLKSQVGTTDGNMASHLRKMEDAGYIEVKKTFSGRKPLTTYSLTVTGRNSFEEYIKKLEFFIKTKNKNTGA